MGTFVFRIRSPVVSNPRAPCPQLWFTVQITSKWVWDLCLEGTGMRGY
jgi:hypothetical protein